MSIFETTALNKAGVTPDSAAAKAVMSRENIFEMTQSAEEAVLRPRECGMFPHDVRAALAARVAHLAGDEMLAAQYLATAGDAAPLARLSETGEAHQLAAVVGFVDKVANQTRDVATEDISGLQASGVPDADIVRLCELVAFLAYQIRVISGLRLMQGNTG